MDELFIGDTVIVQFCNNSALRCKNPNITKFHQIQLWKELLKNIFWVVFEMKT